MKTLTKEQIIQINIDLDEDGVVLNEGNLDYAIEFANMTLNPNRYAARLLWSLIHNHPFLDGNKRTAIMAILMILKENNLRLKHNAQDELEILASKIARGKIKAYIKNN